MSTGKGLALRNLHVTFGKLELLRGIDLDVAPGETLVLFGTSGGGKTVLLRAVAGLEPAARGQVFIDGRDVSQLGPEHRGIGMAFQNFALYPHMPARANISSPLEARRIDRDTAGRRVAEVSSMLKIGHVLDHMPRELSNGQKQRTALARALVGEPHVLLLDDPLRNVDAKLRYEMRLELPRLLRRAGAATIYISQDYREAMALGDRVAILEAGRIVQAAPPEIIYDLPGTVTVARLFGDPPINLLPCRPELHSGRVLARVLSLELPLAIPAREAARECLLGLRPEAIAVLAQPQPGAAAAQVVAATPLHERLVLLLRAAGGEEVVASVIGGGFAAGDRVWLSAAPEAALLFDARSGVRIDSRALVAEAAE